MQTKLLNKQRILLLLSASLTYYISRNQIIISKIESLFNIKIKINNSFTEVGIIIHILFTFFKNNSKELIFANNWGKYLCALFLKLYLLTAWEGIMANVFENYSL